MLHYFRTLKDEILISEILLCKRNGFLNATAFLGIIVSLFYTCMFCVERIFGSALLAFASIVIFGIVLLLSKLRIRTTYVCYGVTAIIFSGILLLFISQSFQPTVLLWSLLFPIIALSLVGLSLGTIVSTVVLITAITFNCISPTTFTNIHNVFYCVYIGIYILSFCFEMVRRELCKQQIKLTNAVTVAEQTISAKNEMLIEMSHQVRTPLNSIVGITSLLKNEYQTKEQRSYLETINTSVMNLSRVLDSMKNISELDKDNDNDNVASFNFSGLIHAKVKSFSKLHPSLVIKTNINISNHVPLRLIGNTKKLEVLLENLFETIILHSKKNEAAFDLYVSDKKENSTTVELLFELHTASLVTLTHEIDHVNGTIVPIANMGQLIELFDLHNAKSIAESLGGTIGHKKKDSNINIFWFTIVLLKEQTIGMESKSLQRENDSHHIALSESTALIVEDNLMNQKVLSLMLEPHVKNIEIANNGKEALKMLENSRFDFILMDLQMPILDGYKTTERIRELEMGTGFHIPIIALTAHVLHNDKEKCLAIGMDDYISKPVEKKNIIEKINKYLNCSID